MKLLDYLTTSVLKEDDVFLLDGADGTRNVKYSTLADLLKARNEIKSSDQLFDWLDNIGIPVEVRKTIFRGKNLGTSLTKEQAKSIADGTFKGLFLGDYWLCDRRNNDTTTTGTGACAIYDFDYWWRQGISPTLIGKHHITIMGRGWMYIYSAGTQTLKNGYLGIDVQNKLHSVLPNLFSSCFRVGDYLSRPDIFSNATENGKTISNTMVNDVIFTLPTLSSLGLKSPNYLDEGGERLSFSLINIAGIKYAQDWGFNPTFTRDIASETSILSYDPNSMNIVSNTVSNGTMVIRPIFGITGEATAA